jgi:hypothetical protein
VRVEDGDNRSAAWGVTSRWWTVETDRRLEKFEEVEKT